MTSEPVETVDFRGRKMPSREGGGWAKSRRDDAVARLERHGIIPSPNRALPLMLTEPVPGMLEFWLLWHLHGGFDGLLAVGMSEATIYRKIKAFRQAYAIHPDEYRLPGVTVDVERFIEQYSWDVREGPDPDDD